MRTKSAWLSAAVLIVCGLRSTAAGPEQSPPPPGGAPLRALQPAAAVKGLSEGAGVAEAADFYYFGTQPVPLRRSRTEAVIRFRNSTATGMRQLSGSSASLLA